MVWSLPTLRLRSPTQKMSCSVRYLYWKDNCGLPPVTHHIQIWTQTSGTQQVFTLLSLRRVYRSPPPDAPSLFPTSIQAPSWGQEDTDVTNQNLESLMPLAQNQAHATHEHLCAPQAAVLFREHSSPSWKTTASLAPLPAFPVHGRVG
jgi:hypothetical protein